VRVSVCLNLCIRVHACTRTHKHLQHVSTAFIHKHILSHTHSLTLSRARSLSLQVQNVSTAFIGEHGQATAKLDELEFAVDGLLYSLSLSLSLSHVYT